MRDPKGFLTLRRATPGRQAVEERVRHWREFYGPVPEAAVRAQGARCMDCGVPFCQGDTGCPVRNIIPEWNDLVSRGEWHDALESLHATNNFPELTGRLCPAPCESACVLDINDDAVTIEQIELAHVTDFAERDLLRRLVEQHAHYTGSARAKRELGQWERALRNFVAVVPREYRQVLDRQREADNAASVARHGLAIAEARHA